MVFRRPIDFLERCAVDIFCGSEIRVPELTESWSIYFALVPKIVIPRSSTRRQRNAGSRSGLPSYRTNVHPTLRALTRKFHIIQPLGQTCLENAFTDSSENVRGRIVEEHIFGLQVSAYDELLLGLEQHSASSMNDGPEGNL